MKNAFLALAIILAVLLFVGNQLLDERNEIQAQKSEIETQWKRLDSDMKERADRLPNVLDMAKRHAVQPDEVIFAEIERARTALLSARGKQDEMAANNVLDDLIPRLLLIQKRHSQNENEEDVVAILDELARQQNQIAMDRRDYNDAITKYNTGLELFPQNVAAAVFGFHRDDAYFKTTEKDKNFPHVKF